MALAQGQELTRTFPFWATVWWLYALTRQNLPMLWRMSWRWQLITAPVLFGDEYLCSVSKVSELNAFLNGVATVTVPSLIALPMLSSVAVA
jgi:hypothetical protein